mmetsp:Transcript_25163/g.42111  ORF Transcript_25163/g.42111 Transcript_25163/m.42111 type:complete len:325 (+) Transcript_25163:250-1224(+)
MSAAWCDIRYSNDDSPACSCSRALGYSATLVTTWSTLISTFSSSMLSSSSSLGMPSASTMANLPLLAMVMYMMADSALLFTLSSSSSSSRTSRGTHPTLTASSLPSKGTHSRPMTLVAPSSTAGSSSNSSGFMVSMAPHSRRASTAGSLTPLRQQRSSSSAMLERPTSSSTVFFTSRGSVLLDTRSAWMSTQREEASTSALYAASRTSVDLSSSMVISFFAAPSSSIRSHPICEWAITSSAAAARSRTISSPSSCNFAIALQMPCPRHCTPFSPVASNSAAARRAFCFKMRSLEHRMRTIFGNANFSNPFVMVWMCWAFGFCWF